MDGLAQGRGATCPYIVGVGVLISVGRIVSPLPHQYFSFFVLASPSSLPIVKVVAPDLFQGLIYKEAKL